MPTSTVTSDPCLANDSRLVFAPAVQTLRLAAGKGTLRLENHGAQGVARQIDVRVSLTADVSQVKTLSVAGERWDLTRERERHLLLAELTPGSAHDIEFAYELGAPATARDSLASANAAAPIELRFEVVAERCSAERKAVIAAKVVIAVEAPAAAPVATKVEPANVTAAPILR
jgi:hypothetical protein